MSTSQVTAMLADKKNTRQVLATELVERNAQCQALREELSTLKATMALLPSPKPATAARLEYLARIALREASGPTPFQLACAAAKEAAIASGKATRVAL